MIPPDETQAAPPGHDQIADRERLYQAIWATTNDAMALSDAAGNVLAANPAYFELYGYTAEQVVGQSFTVIFPPEQRAWAEAAYKESFHHAPAESRYESTVAHHDGTQRVVESRVSFLEQGGQRIAMLSTIRDISERKALEAAMQASLREKDVLLQEVHHRVKNNLQVIISLLRLQALGISDPALSEPLRDIQSRVRSMALVHEQLYAAPDLTHISFRSYVQTLATHMLRSYAMQHGQIALRLDIDPAIVLGIDTAVPLGLVLTELIANSAKYAFQAGAPGTIGVSAHQGAGQLSLRVYDDGVGLPATVDLQSAPSLGLQLVRHLTDQLGASVTLSRAEGTSFQIAIPLKKEKEQRR